MIFSDILLIHVFKDCMLARKYDSRGVSFEQDGHLIILCHVAKSWNVHNFTYCFVKLNWFVHCRSPTLNLSSREDYIQQTLREHDDDFSCIGMTY